MATILLLTHPQAVLATWRLQGELILGAGHSVVVEHDPKQALVNLVESNVELVLADYARVDGGWLCREVKKTRALSHIPVILQGPPQTMSETWMVEHLMRTQYGCSDYLPETVDLNRLRELVDLHLAVGRVKASIADAADSEAA